MDAKVLGTYINGNYTVTLYNDGTKVRENDLDNLTPSFAENCDVCITKKCDGGCQFCYEGCTPEGKHGDLLNQDWIYTMHPYTELAINGNDLSHPQLIQFLEIMKKQNVIVNITVNQKHFEKELKLLHKLVEEELVYGIGVSLNDANEKFVEEVLEFPNIVIHTINGILGPKDIQVLSGHNLKLLILGYKELNRGIDYLAKNNQEIEEKKKWVKLTLPIWANEFDAISFDNLALEQINVKKWLSEEDWKEMYMGDDGTYTYYIDAVNHEFSQNSIAPANERYGLLGSVDAMFKVIQENKSKK